VARIEFFNVLWFNMETGLPNLNKIADKGTTRHANRRSPSPKSHSERQTGMYLNQLIRYTIIRKLVCLAA
jgi:hypothetical protein